MVAKYANSLVKEEMGELLLPRQLRCGVKRGVKAAVHEAWPFIHGLNDDQVFVKLDFRNAFNSGRRDKMLLAAEEMVTKRLPLVHSSYTSPTLLYWGEKSVVSAKGVQH